MNHVNKKGFTLIELMLAMSFISLLLMAIAMTTIQISNIYNKGITLREVNQAGRAISDDISRSIAQSEPFDLGTRYIVKQGGGRLCVGQFTYAWNYGKALAGGVPVYNVYSGDPAQIRLVKVTDPGGSLCDDSSAPINKSVASELLDSGDRDLVVHIFSVTQGNQDPIIKQALYAISITLGTNEQAQLLTNDTACKAPSDGVGDQDYCSVNQFDITARAGNKVQVGN